MGLQIPYCVHPQMQEKGTVWQDTELPWAVVPRAGRAEELQDTGRAYGTRPCSYVDKHAPKVFGCRGGGLPQGEKRHFSGQAVQRQAAEL